MMALTIKLILLCPLIVFARPADDDVADSTSDDPAKLTDEQKRDCYSHRSAEGIKRCVDKAIADNKALNAQPSPKVDLVVNAAPVATPPVEKCSINSYMALCKTGLDDAAKKWEDASRMQDPRSSNSAKDNAVKSCISACQEQYTLLKLNSACFDGLKREKLNTLSSIIANDCTLPTRAETLKDARDMTKERQLISGEISGDTHTNTSFNRESCISQTGASFCKSVDIRGNESFYYKDSYGGVYDSYAAATANGEVPNSSSSETDLFGSGPREVVDVAPVTPRIRPACLDTNSCGGTIGGERDPVAEPAPVTDRAPAVDREPLQQQQQPERQAEVASTPANNNGGSSTGGTSNGGGTIGGGTSSQPNPLSPNPMAWQNTNTANGNSNNFNSGSLGSGSSEVTSGANGSSSGGNSFDSGGGRGRKVATLSRDAGSHGDKSVTADSAATPNGGSSGLSPASLGTNSAGGRDRQNGASSGLAVASKAPAASRYYKAAGAKPLPIAKKDSRGATAKLPGKMKKDRLNACKGNIQCLLATAGMSDQKFKRLVAKSGGRDIASMFNGGNNTTKLPAEIGTSQYDAIREASSIVYRNVYLNDDGDLEYITPDSDVPSH